MTLLEAAKANIVRIRRPIWPKDNSYAKIDLINGQLGPWLHFYDREVQKIIGEPTPQNTFCVGDMTDDYTEYTGAIDPDDTC